MRIEMKLLFPSRASCKLDVRTLLAVVIATCISMSCASTEVTSRRDYTEPGTQPVSQPSRIIVYNFAATPEEVPEDAALAGHWEKRVTAQTDEEIQRGKQLADILAQELTKKILSLGMPVARASAESPPDRGDLLIKGEFVAIDEGDRAKRMLIGFGAGAGHLVTHVECYQVTAEGARLLGQREIKASGGKAPGMLVPVVGGAVAGRAAAAAAVSGGINAAHELGPESLKAAAERTADAITKELAKAFAQRQWIPTHMAE